MVTLVGMLIACGGQGSSRKPVVAIISPPSGSHYAVGESVMINIAAAASSMIQTIEVRSGDALLTIKTFTNTGTTLSAIVTFLPVQTGEIEISMVATDASSAKSDYASITIYVGSQSVFPLQTTDVVITPTTAAPLPECQLAATFMADITIPDGSLLTVGSVYTKTWRVRNTSQCAWLDGYVLAFIDGEPMNAPMTVPVPPTARDATVDINVPITAPTNTGVYSSTWRMRAPGGSPFGNRLYILVRVQ